MAAGLGALGFLTVGRFALGLTEFAPMAHVWTVWSMGAATVGFGAQIQTVERMSRGRGPLSVRHARLALSGAAVAGLVTMAWRVPLFGSESLFWPLVCTLIPLGSVVTGAARGRLAGNARSRALAIVIAGENIVRFGLAGVLLLIGTGAESFAIIVLAGFVVAIVGLGSGGREGAVADEAAKTSGVAGAAAGLVAHSCLVLPPTVLALRGESPELVAAIFLVLTYLRAPYQFLLGMSPVLTARSFGERTDWISAWLAYRKRAALLAGVSVVMAFGFGFGTGDVLSAIMLGTTEIVEPIDFAILCALVVAAAVAILRTLYVLADGGSALVLRSWGSAGLVAVLSALVPGEPRVLSIGLLVGLSICLIQLNLSAPESD